MPQTTSEGTEARPTDASNSELAVLRSEIADLRRQLNDEQRDTALRKALASVTWFNEEEAYRELRDKVSRNAEGRWEVSSSNAGSKPALLAGTEACPTSLDEAVRELAARKPHWVRAKVSGGTGAGGSAGGVSGAGSVGAAAGVLSYADLLRPENKELLQEFVHHRKEELERMRQMHFGA